MRIISSFAPLVVMALISVLLALGLRHDPQNLPSAMIDRPLPAFDLPPVRAEPDGLKRADVIGEVAMINVFASWCEGCRIEHPVLMRASRAGRVPIYGVDWKDDRAKGAAWLIRHGDPYTRVGADINSALAIDLGLTGAPETYIIDRKGRIRYKQIGPITDNIWIDTIEPILRKLEQEGP
ncbi:MAG: DsbE family thiol:disulfide interchange protein [Parvularculaceae bacterium]